jgi:lipopolysaccharide transport system permease protein
MSDVGAAIAADHSLETELPKDGWVIEPRRPGFVARARDLWHYRRLMRYFAVRTIEKMTRRTILGRGWLFIRPLFPLLVMTLVFGGALGVPSDGIPYFVFLVVGTAVWDLFASALMWATRSLDLNRGLLTKIYIPRTLLPIACIAPSLVTFAIYLALALCTGIYFWIVDGRSYFVLGSGMLWSLLAAMLSLALAIGIGFWTAFPALVARDVRFSLGYVLGFWVFLTPVMYPLSEFPQQWRWAVLLNPMAAYVEMFKWGLLGRGGIHPREIAIAVSITAAVMISGLWFFDRSEAEAADKV